MLGYLRATAPGYIEPPGVFSGEVHSPGWYDTGDIVEVDSEGYVAIKGRAKRFAKIGGEMVSMTAAEALAGSLWPDDQHAVLALPDARKGERLLLLTTRKTANIGELLAHARSRGVPELMVARTLIVIDA